MDQLNVNPSGHDRNRIYGLKMLFHWHCSSDHNLNKSLWRTAKPRYLEHTVDHAQNEHMYSFFFVGLA